MAFTAIGALVAGEAVSTTLVLGAMAEIGTTMSIVGAVTGSKSLMKIGAVIGLVGGVGGMVAGATGAAGSAAVAEAGSSGAVDAVNGADLMSDAFTASGATGAGGFGAAADGAVGGVDLGSMIDDAQSSLGDYVNGMDKASDLAQSATSGVTAPEPLMQTGADSVLQNGTNDTALVGQQPSAVDSYRNGADVASDQVTGTVNTGAAASMSPLPPSGAKDYFSGFLKWVQNNQRLANGVLKMGGEALLGMSQADIASKKLAEQKRENDMRYGYGNQVASYGFAPLIGTRT